MYPKEFFDYRSRLYDSNGTCFVAMPFAKKFNKIWKQYIKNAIVEAGLSPVRVDGNPLSSSILIEILEGIAIADIVLADLTGSNPNVFYEVGLAHAIKFDTQVILITQDIGSVPFDLRHLRCFEYKISGDRYSPAIPELAQIIKNVLIEQKTAYEKEGLNIKLSLAPIARKLVEDHGNQDYLNLNYSVYEPRDRRDVDIALPLWFGLLDLLSKGLIEFRTDTDGETSHSAYWWTERAIRFLGVGKDKSTSI